MSAQLVIGVVFKGFCNGFFGRDSYQEKRVEAFGYDWIVARDSNGSVHYCNFTQEWLPKRDELIAEWLSDPGYE